MAESKQVEEIVTNQGNEAPFIQNDAKRSYSSPLQNDQKRAVPNPEPTSEEIDAPTNDGQSEVTLSINKAVKDIITVQQREIDAIQGLKKNNKQLLKIMMQVMGPVMTTLGAVIVQGINVSKFSKHQEDQVRIIVSPETILV